MNELLDKFLVPENFYRVNQSGIWHLAGIWQILMSCIADQSFEVKFFISANTLSSTVLPVKLGRVSLLTSVQCVAVRDAHQRPVGCALHQVHLPLAAAVVAMRLIGIVCA